MKSSVSLKLALRVMLLSSVAWGHPLSGSETDSDSGSVPKSIWYHSSCNEEAVKAMNEGRWIAKELAATLKGRRESDVLAYLDWPMRWFFGFGLQDAAYANHKQIVIGTLDEMGSLTRTNNREDPNVKVRVYCDNQNSWRPVDQGIRELPPLFRKSDQAAMNTYVRHQLEGAYGFGEDLDCRHLDDQDRSTGTRASTAVDDRRRGGIAELAVFLVELCDSLLNGRFPTTTNDAAELDLAQFAQAALFKTKSAVFIHELVHVPPISTGFVDGVDIYAPDDDHKIPDPTVPGGFRTVNGYYRTNDPNTPAALPGGTLPPAYSVQNPDSYAYLSLAYRLYLKGWRMTIQDYKLKFDRDEPQPGTERAKDWIDENGRKKWAGPEWPTNDPNWSNAPTPP